MQAEYLEAIDDLLTVRDVLRWGISQFNQADIFYGHGTDNAWDEALQLILYSLNLPLDVDKELLSCRLTHMEREKIIRLFFERIQQRVPAAYLTHHAWFAGLEFYVDERVLIPRSPLAELIEHQCAPWVEPAEVHQILDLCTGSGCIAIAAAMYLPDATVDASDLSPLALEVAEKNAKKHQVTDRVHFINSDLFNDIPPKAYDLILSNPPYVDAQDMADLPAEYHHEPQLGLSAGVDGLELVDRLLQQAGAYLAPQGVLIVEVGNSAAALEEKYPKVPFTWLDFSRGGEGVFLLTAQQLKEHWGEQHGR